MPNRRFGFVGFVQKFLHQFFCPLCSQSVSSFLGPSSNDEFIFSVHLGHICDFAFGDICTYVDADLCNVRGTGQFDTTSHFEIPLTVQSRTRCEYGLKHTCPSFERSYNMGTVFI